MKTQNCHDIVLCTVTGIQQYGIFVSVNDDHVGLIHISEISYGYVHNVNDFVRVGDEIYAEIIDNSDEKHLKLSIKDIDYRHDGSHLKRMKETSGGFEPLKNHLTEWINTTIKEITDKM